MYRDSIGIVGGFGGYATLDFFKNLLDEFHTGYERDYPRICMDNDFSMPSRTKVLLEDLEEDYNVIVKSISNSIGWLIQGGCTHIILACGTAHNFLPAVYMLHPEYKKYVHNIIEITRDYLMEHHFNEVFILAAEGTLKTRIYNSFFEEHNIITNAPKECEYKELRCFIESVKQNKIDRKTGEDFIEFLERYGKPNVILGCTEFPVLISEIKKYNEIANKLNEYKFINPLELTIMKLKETIQ